MQIVFCIGVYDEQKHDEKNEKTFYPNRREAFSKDKKV